MTDPEKLWMRRVLKENKVKFRVSFMGFPAPGPTAYRPPLLGKPVLLASPQLPPHERGVIIQTRQVPVKSDRGSRTVLFPSKIS